MTHAREDQPGPDHPAYLSEQPPEDYGDRADRIYTKHKDEHDNTK